VFALFSSPSLMLYISSKSSPLSSIPSAHDNALAEHRLARFMSDSITTLSFPLEMSEEDVILVAKERMVAKLLALGKALGNVATGASLGTISYCELERGIFMNKL